MPSLEEKKSLSQQLGITMLFKVSLRMLRKKKIDIYVVVVKKA